MYHFINKNIENVGSNISTSSDILKVNFVTIYKNYITNTLRQTVILKINN